MRLFLLLPIIFLSLLCHLLAKLLGNATSAKCSSAGEQLSGAKLLALCLAGRCHSTGMSSRWAWLFEVSSSVCGGPASSVFSSAMQAFQGRWRWGMTQKILEPGAGSLHEDRRGAGHVEANPQAMSPVRGCFLSGTACTLSSDPSCHFLY